MVVSVVPMGMAAYLLCLSRRNIAAAPTFFLPVLPARRLGVSAAEMMVVPIVIVVVAPMCACIVTIAVSVAISIQVVAPVAPLDSMVVAVVIFIFVVALGGSQRRRKCNDDY